jgi:hypothetical protein
MAKAGYKAAKGSRFKRWTVASLKIGTVIALLGLMVVGIFVAIARGEIESFEDLKSSPNGQMIRVRAADGTVIQTLGPSFGRWMTHRRDPARDEGCDGRGRGSPLLLSSRHRSLWPGACCGCQPRPKAAMGCGRRSTITQQLARNVYLNNNRDIGPQAARDDPGAGDGDEIQQGADSRAVSEQGLFWRRGLWRRCREPPILRSWCGRYHAGRSDDHRGLVKAPRTIRPPPMPRRRLGVPALCWK